MGHVPHLLVPGTWDRRTVELDEHHRHHLLRVLRMTDGEPVSYTDGDGLVGLGRLQGTAVKRGDESRVPRDVPHLTVAAVPLHDKQRNRFMVEKLAELGTSRLVWWRSAFGQGRPAAKAQQWADQAVEQSRSAWRMVISDGSNERLPTPMVVAHPDGGAWPATTPATVMIGPEGGWSETDLEADWTRVSLGPRILRSETAAVVAAARVLSAKSDSRDQ